MFDKYFFNEEIEIHYNYFLDIFISLFRLLEPKDKVYSLRTPPNCLAHAYFCPINEQTDFNHIFLVSISGQALTSYLKCLSSWIPFCFHMQYYILELYISLVSKVINSFIQNIWFCLFFASVYAKTFWFYGGYNPRFMWISDFYTR